MAGTDAAHAMNFAHDTFHDRLGSHGHFGRALVETIAEVCREHPAIVGLVAGIAVEQLLAREKVHHDQQVAARAASGEAPDGSALPPPMPHEQHRPLLPRAAPGHTPHHLIRLGALRPGRIAMEVFGALLLFKFTRGVARMFKRGHADPWFAPAGKIHLISGTLAAYYIAKSLKSPKISSWRNAAAALFATDAIKPLLKVRRDLIRDQAA